MLVYSHSTHQFAQAEAGGKGYALYLAQSLGCTVPKWVVIGRGEFRAFINDSKIKGEIDTLLSKVVGGASSSKEVAQEIERLFERTPATPQLQSCVSKGYAYIGPSSPIAVRSSCADEDGAHHSFAGQLSSFLYVEGEVDALTYVKRCFASAFSERCLAYRKENNLSFDTIEVGVILQEMVDPDVSGVLFTCDPVALSIEQYVVSAVYGVGEGLVSGLLDADSYWISASTGALVRSEIVEKQEELRSFRSGETQKKTLSAEKREVATLSSSDLHALYLLGKKLATSFGRPQDAEWAIKNGVVYLLQTRPVTSLSRDLTGYPNLWDNSNIVESYGGITSPLSFTFALNNYRLVYQQFCEILGVPHRIVREMDYYLRNMLGCINGRVYYNLYNWYKLIGVLPGFNNNREFMETMMGVSEKLTEEIHERISPHPSWYTWRGTLRKIRVGIRFAFYHCTIQTIVDSFLEKFRATYKKFREIEYSRLSGDRIFQHYLAMEREMIGDWKAPIINDFLCMVHFGILRKLTTKWLSSLDPHVHNDLLSGDGTIESAEPTRELLRLATKVHGIPALKECILTTPPHELLEALNQSQFKEFYGDIREYINKFGFRCMNEMKLEEVDLFSDPSYLFTCLKNYLHNSILCTAPSESREREIRHRAEQLVGSHLSGIRALIFRWVLYHARKAVRNRENTRFARTRAYGITRTMFQAMGRDLSDRGIIPNPKDIFYLTLEEVYGIYQGTLSCYSLQEFITIRKTEYARFEREEPAPRFLTRGAVYWNTSFSAQEISPMRARDDDCDLRGLPCCPGVVEGIVKVVTTAQGDLNLNGEILVTPRTDPGWVPLYPSVSGLLVERGSLLSHSAIVAREMGLPAIVGIQGLTKVLASGMRVRIDGAKGTVVILR